MGKKINNLLVNLSSSSFTQREEETTQSSLENRRICINDQQCKKLKSCMGVEGG